MKILKFLFLFLFVLLVGGFVVMSFVDVPVQQQDVVQDISPDRFERR